MNSSRCHPELDPYEDVYQFAASHHTNIFPIIDHRVKSRINSSHELFLFIIQAYMVSKLGRRKIAA